MSELKRVKRPIRTMDSFEDNTLDIDNSISKENTFEGLCAKKAIKPGMMVRFFSVEDSRISLEYEETGDSQNREFELDLWKGIVVEEKDGSLSIVSLLTNTIGFRGRFARAYFCKTLDKVCNLAFSESNFTARPLTIDEYGYYFNNSFLFSSYVFNSFSGDSESQLFIDSYSAINKKGYVTSLYFDKIQYGDILIKIIPNKAECNLEDGEVIQTRYATSWDWECTPFKKYVVFGERE